MDSERRAGPLAAWALLAFVGLAASACSDPFEHCSTTRSCKGPDASASGGADSGAGTGGANSGGSNSGGTTVGGSGGSTAATGGNPGVPEAGTLDAGDAGDGDAPVVPECSATETLCGRGPGVCADLMTDLEHCGACDVACAATGTTARLCEGGVCKPTCGGSHRDCNSDGKDGCEADLDSNPDHCGTCDIACSPDGTTSRGCVQGLCRPTCDDSHGDCNDDGKDGCETNTDTDADHCGACRYICSPDQASARACAGGICKPTCLPTHGDCAARAPAPDDGCETDIRQPEHCGACGHDCQGGICTPGNPVAPKCEVVIIASGLRRPQAFAVDDLWVHWSDSWTYPNADGRIARARSNGSTFTPIPIASNQAFPLRMAADGQYVYWSVAITASQHPFAVRRVPSGGVSVVDLVDITDTDVYWPDGLAVQGTNVYFLNWESSNSGIFSVPKDGSSRPVEVVANLGTTPYAIAVDATHIYFSEGYVKRAPIAGGQPTTVDSQSQGDGILAIDATHVYYSKFTTGQGIHRKAKTLQGLQGASVPVVALGATVRDIAVDATHLYYADTTTLFRVRKTGGGTAEPVSVVVDDVVALKAHGGAVYWVNRGSTSTDNGSIMKIVP